MTDPGETESIVSLKLFSSLFSGNFVKIERLLTPCKGMSILESKTFLLMESGIRENFACGIRNPGVWNPEYSSTNPESHNNPLTLGIQNPKFHGQRLESGMRRVEYRIQASLGPSLLSNLPRGWALGYKASAMEASLLDAILSDVHPTIRMKVVWPHVIVGAFMLRLTLKVEANKISGYPMQRNGHKLFVL